MSNLKSDLLRWNDAVVAFDQEDFNSALEIFDSIADSAKIHFNIGVILATLGDHVSAITAHVEALKSDNYFAVGYFQKGVSNFLLENFEDALEDFNDALLYLRSNLLIDYTQLGLDYKLYSCEVLFNRALCYIYLGQEEKAISDLDAANKDKQTADHDVIGIALQQGVDDLSVFAVPPGTIYRPPEAKIKNVKKVDYLGSSKLIAAVDRSEMFTGFKGAHLRKIAQGTSAKDEPMPPVLQRSATSAGRSNNDSSGNPYKNNQFTRKAALLKTGENDPGTVNSSFSSTSGRLGLHRRPTDATATTGSTRLSQASAFPSINTKAALLRANTYSPSAMSDTNKNSPLSQPKRSPLLPMVNSSNSGIGLQGYLSDIGGGLAVSTGGGSENGSQLGSPRLGSPDVSANRMLKVKCHYTDTRVLLVDPSLTFAQFLERVQQKFNAPKSLKLKYKDEDDEFVLMTDQEDMDLARGLHMHAADQNSLLRMEVWCFD